jgi:predicted transcriptional regulator
MTTKVTVTLPDEIYKRVERMAELVGRDASEVIVQKLSDDLPPIPSEMDARPVAALSDEEVLAAADSMMDRTMNARMSELLQKQQAAPLDETEQVVQDKLMEIYSSGQLRKAEAWVEAVKRGLRQPPKP